MNTKEYIESGTLDLYVAGLLSTEEMRDVELMACQYPEIKTELQSMQSSLEKYAMKYAMEPPPGLKERIMKVVEDESAGEQEKAKPIVREISSSKPSYSWILAAASVVFLIVATAFAIRFATQMIDYRQQLAELKEEQTTMRYQLNAARESLSKNQDQIAVMTDPNTMMITMKGTAMSPQSMAMIFWNKESKSVYLDVKNLPVNSSDKQYQLWFIDPNNKPVSAGVFDSENGMFMKMIDAPDAVAFAVTLEPRGGSENPTMDQMYVIGKVNS